MIAYIPLFNRQNSKIEFYTIDKAWDDIVEILIESPGENIRYEICFVFDFDYKVYSSKAINKLENLGYQAVLLKPTEKLLWSIVVVIDLVIDAHFLVETEIVVTKIVEEFKGSYADRFLMSLTIE
jgi:hypothetical protein